MSDLFLETPASLAIVQFQIPQPLDELSEAFTNSFQNLESQIILTSEFDIFDFEQGALPPPESLPHGYVPYADGGYYMKNAQGEISLTPRWQQQVDEGSIDWVGVVADLSIIVGAGISILSVWGAAIGGVIVAGADAIKAMIEGGGTREGDVKQ